ncbi:hypothetical protein KQI63_13000 [bacterium]|nr:hypothetical protein [bacterium]
MKRVALVTSQELATLLPDERLLVTALEERGIEANAEVWNDPDADWLKYNLILVRTPWDYSDHAEEFLAWLDRLEATQAPLLNPPATLRWNLNKRYLLELRNKGANLLTTMVVQSGDPWTLEHHLRSLLLDEAVIKPLVSASARGTWRLHVDFARVQQEKWTEALAKQEMMVQEYAPEIEREGEWSLIYFNGEYSHAVVKKPKAGDFRVQERHGGSLELGHPTPALIDQGKALLEMLDEVPLYARVDGIVRYNQLFLMELELLEPQLFFSMVPESADRFAELVEQRLDS